ncbi:MAG: cytochrome c biogenesis CcdA family protein [Gemmatimonadales bacterium]
MTDTEIGIAIAFTAGIFSFLSPCVLPLVPSYLAFVTGMSLEDLEAGVNRKQTLLHATLFVAGFSAVFVLLGVTASFLGAFFATYRTWITRVGGVVIIVLGLHLAGILRLTPLLKEKRIHLADKPVGYLGTIGVGAVFGAGWTPCLGPQLGAILTLGFAQETMWSGAGLLSVYSLGLAVPFLVAALALDWFLQTFQKFRRWMPVVEKASGALLIFLGLLLVTGRFTVLAAWLQRYTPAWIFERI